MKDYSAICKMFEEVRQINIDIKKLVSNQETTPAPFNVDEINSIKEYVLNSNDTVIEALERIEQNNAQPRTEKKHIIHSINPKSLGFVIPVVLLFIFLVSTLVFMYNLKFDMERISDNDLKYRYIKMQGGITADSIKALEKKFYPMRDRNWIKEIQNNVYKYEETILQESINITNAKMKEEEAKRYQKNVKDLGLD